MNPGGEVRAAALAAARDVIAHEAAAVTALAARIDQRFADAVDILCAASGRVVVTGLGKSGAIGRKIAATLASLGTPAFFVHAAEAHHGDLGMIEPGDALLALSNSGETAEVRELAQLVKDRGGVVVTLTGCAGASSLALLADVALDVSVVREADPHDLAPTSSTTAALAMGDALAVALSVCRGFGPADFAHRHPGGSLGQRLGAVTTAGGS